MLMQPTLDKLYSMKLTGMVEAIRRQMEDPEASRLSFEERLALLVDQQWDWRQNKALERRLKSARFKTAAAVEDIDYRHPRRLDRQLIRSLSACDWVRHHQNVIVTGPCGVGKSFIAGALAQKAVREGFTSLYVRAPRLFRDLAELALTAALARSWTALPASTSFWSMIGPWLRWPTVSAATFWKSAMTATPPAPRFSPARCRSLNGTIKSATPPSPTAFWTGLSTMLTASSYKALRCGSPKTVSRPMEPTPNEEQKSSCP